MPFHRLAVPSYFGGLPGGFDYINNALTGTPAFADGVKSGGPNAGTYFVGFGEDATSSDANRPALALAQNTDFLDNLLRRDIAVPVRSNNATGAPTASVTLTGPGLFMGLVGAQIKDLFRVTDSNDEDIDVAGAKVTVNTAVDSGGVLVGGGFSLGDVTLTFNISIPAAQVYHLYYAQRTNFATFPADGLTTISVRSTAQVDFKVEELFRLLHGNGENWNDPWDSTVWDLTARGMNETYRRSTTGLTGAFNTPGSGGTIIRDGVAPEVDGNQSARAYIDPFQALYMLRALETGADRTTQPFGSSGLVFRGTGWRTQGSNFATVPTPPLYAFAAFMDHTNNAAGSPTASNGGGVAVSPGNNATIATTGTPGVFHLVLTDAGAHFFKQWVDGSSVTHKESVIGLGKDVLVCTIPSIGKVALILTEFDFTDTSGASGFASTLDSGTLPTLPAGPTAITINAWSSPRYSFGLGAASTKIDFTGASLGSNAWLDDMFFCAPSPAALTTDVTDTTGAWHQHFVQVNAYFGGDIDYTQSPPTLGSALGWGSLQRDATQGNHGVWRRQGNLWADGSFTVPNGLVTGALNAGTLAANVYGLVPAALGGTAHNAYHGTNIFFSENAFGPAPAQGQLSGFGRVTVSGYGNLANEGFQTGVGPIELDFSTEILGDTTLTAQPFVSVIERRFFTPAAGACLIDAIKLPLNSGIGDKYYLIISSVTNTALASSTLVGVTGRSSGSSWRISVFGLPTNLANTLGVTEIFELTCVYAGSGNTFTFQTTYVMTNYTNIAGLNSNFLQET